MSTTTNNTSNNSKSNWGPYAGPADFGANMGIILAALFAALALALSATAALRFLHNRSRDRRRLLQNPPTDPEKQQQQQQPPPPPPMLQLTFSSAETVKSSECAICLTEFADGDRVRVLPACRHGFHGACVERWWLHAAAGRRRSCPTCRASCCQATAAEEAEKV